MSGQVPLSGTSQPFRLYTPAVDFMQNRMSQYHSAFDMRGFYYDPAQQQFVAVAPNLVVGNSSSLAVPGVPPPPQPRPTPGSINDMGFWGDIFPKAMKRLNDEPEPRGGPQSRWRIRNKTVWRDVQAVLDMAQREYDFRHGSQHVGKFRRKLRDVLNKVNAPLQQGMKIVPSVDIASPVISVINMLLDAYRQATEVRETVNSGFDDLPACFARMDFYFKTYPNDQNIITSSIDLVFTTFKAIEEAVEFYTSYQAQRAGLAVLTGPQYQQNLWRCLNEIKSGSDALENEARLSFTHRMISDNDQTRRSHATLMQGNSATHQALGTILHEGRVGLVGMTWLGNLINRALSLLEDKEKNWPPRSPIPSRSTTPRLGDAPQWTPRDLWSRLHIPNLDETDLHNVLNSAADIIFQDRGRAEQVVETRLFRNWILTPSSARLLVHGDFSGVNKVSPFSILCATVMQAFRMTPGVISLAFFCGCHLSLDDYRGGTVMVRSLVAQLLRQFPSFAIDPDPGISMQAVDNGDTDQLCRLFVHLIRQLPPKTTVFCLIDGINEYESEEYLHDMDGVVMALVDLVDEADQKTRAKVKLLLTSPQPTVEVRHVFDDVPEALLHVSQLPLVGGGVGFAGLQEQLGGGIIGEIDTDPN